VPSGAQIAPTQIGLATLRENAGGKTAENAGDSSGGTTEKFTSNFFTWHINRRRCHKYK